MPTTWFWQSVIGAFFLIPGWIAIPFFQKNFGVRPEDFIVWYLLAAAFAPVFFGSAAVVPGPGVAASIMAVGLVVGYANILAYRATVNNPPNPGIPVAIFTGLSTTGVVLATIALAYLLPKYFNTATIDFRTIAGVAFIIAGMWLIAPR
jgi:hypothetical protein